MPVRAPHTLRKMAWLAGELNGQKPPRRPLELFNDPLALREALRRGMERRTVKVSRSRLP